MKIRLTALAIAVALIAAACGGSDIAAPAQVDDTAPAQAGEETLPEALRIANRGDSSEGHTPRTFAGSGTGLFAGDNLNPNFPNGAGIQILLTFDLPAGTPLPTTARLTSDALSVRGDAFETLGPLQAEPISYDTFGPPLFDLAADGPATTCARQGSTTVTCDTSEATRQAIQAGDDMVQLRLQFTTMSDNDGQQDLALFFLTDSNTNEPGIFFLELAYE